jgi:hypothetical protein
MSIKVYCRECGRGVVLDDKSHGSVGRCMCGYTITARQDSFGKYFYLYEPPEPPPDLGVSVSDGIGAEDKLR